MLKFMQLLLRTSLYNSTLGVSCLVGWLVAGGRSLCLLGTLTPCVWNLYYFLFGWLYMR
jgi:hypothetical protein